MRLAFFLFFICLFLYPRFVNGDVSKVSWQFENSFDENEASLVVSNYPESIKYPGTILNKKISKKKLRLVYYHKNQAENNLYLSVSVRNNDRVPAKLQIVNSLAGPAKDGIFAGHMSTKDFLKKQQQGNMDEITILPGITKQLVYHKLKKENVSVGFVDIEKKNKVDISVKLQVVEPLFENVSGLNESLGRNQYNYGMFGQIEKEIDFKYDCGPGMQSFLVGGEPYLVDKTHDVVLKGNYGLCYNIRVILSNRYLGYRRVILYFSPNGGMARASIVIDDEIVETGFFHKYNNFAPEKVFEFVLEPGEVRPVLIKTIPQPGSFYPVSFILKTDILQYARSEKENLSKRME
jgi:hypothetical protein